MTVILTHIAELNRVGKTTAKRLANLGIFTVQDLLLHFPFRYDSFSQTKIAELVVGESASISGIVEMINNKRSARRKMNITEALISDGEDFLKVVWFNQPFLIKNIKAGDNISIAGKVEEDFNGLVIKSPVYEKNLISKAIHTEGLVPNYHLTANLTQKQLRFLLSQVIKLAKDIPDWLPEEIRKAEKLISLEQAIQKIHFPKNQKDIDQAKERIGFDELFLIQLQAQIIRKKIKSSQAQAISFLEQLTKDFVASLPFKLTIDQRKSAWEILQAINSTKPMTRLLEGDVGSGKTVVAVLAMLNASKNGLQSALMVPTEILAKQHFSSINKLMTGLGINIALFTRTNRYLNNFDQKLSKKEIIEIIKSGQADIIIGTHALIQEDVEFKNLSLVVIDEQHRFGVEQRQAIMKKTKSDLIPHLLSMTATPIPRSLALAMYDDLDISIIKEMPKNRQKIITKIVDSDQQDTYDFIKQEILAGRQAFVICPLIDESDLLGAKSVKQEYEKLNKLVFPDLPIGLIHGKLKPEEKSQAMEDFLNQKTKILVATSVIEVGIDIPNASVMMIENADHFGLAQLHQYRGRVGRGEHQSYCFLLKETGIEENKRLQAMLEYDNGFDLAKADLKFRGPGQVYGKLQKGFPQLKVASLYDFILMKKAKESASKILLNDPELKQNKILREKLGEIEEKIHLE
ncbi:MAG: ATP-dependent DNA helicase RecG [bacterium]